MKPVTYTWIPQDASAICAAQTAIPNVPLLLNGTLPNGFIGSGILKYLIINMTDAYTGNVLITGATIGGIVITDTVEFSATTSNQSNLFFESISQVVLDSAGAVGNMITVGTAQTGYIGPFLNNKYSTNQGMALQLNVTGTGNTGVNVELGFTLSDLDNFADISEVLESGLLTAGIIIPTPFYTTNATNLNSPGPVWQQVLPMPQNTKLGDSLYTTSGADYSVLYSNFYPQVFNNALLLVAGESVDLWSGVFTVIWMQQGIN